MIRVVDVVSFGVIVNRGAPASMNSVNLSAIRGVGVGGRGGGQGEMDLLCFVAHRLGLN